MRRPKISIVFAKALESEALDSCLKDHNTTSLTTLPRNIAAGLPGVVVTKQLIAHLKSTPANCAPDTMVEPEQCCPSAETEYRCRKVTIESLDIFFANCIAGKYLTGDEAKYQNLYLQWEIGPEVFWTFLRYQDKLNLSSSYVGGVKHSESIVLHCQVVQKLRWPTIENEWNRLRESDFDLEDDINPHYPRRPDVLFNGFARAMQCLACGLQDILLPRLLSVSTSQWGVDMQVLSRDHLWKNVGQSEVHLDLEGAVNLLLSHWEELFGPSFNAAGITFSDIKVVQAACIGWATQSGVTTFAHQYVLDFIQMAYKILSAFGHIGLARELVALHKLVFAEDVDPGTALSPPVGPSE